MSEANVWERVRNGLTAAKAIDKRLRYAHVCRVENGVVAGMPDVNYCNLGTEGHIELKHRADRPSRIGTSVFTNRGLRDEQVVWIYHRCKAGGRVFIATQVDDAMWLHRMSTDVVQLYNGWTFSELERRAVRSKEHG